MSDIESLQKSYDTLKRHVEALEEEWRDQKALQIVNEFETEFLEEQTARELGVAGALAVGLSVLHSTIKVLLPARVAAPVVGGCWVFGGVFIAWRLTAGTVAGWVASTERNARRKRMLQQKLQLIEDRIHLILATQGIMVGEEGAAATPGGAGTEDLSHVSPPGSTGSSAELVEAPGNEESFTAESSGAGGGAGAPSSGGEPAKGMDSWRQYATLGRRKKE